MHLLHFPLPKKLLKTLDTGYNLNWGYLMGCLPCSRKMSEDKGKSVFCTLQVECVVWLSTPKKPHLTRFSAELSEIS
jgi:hypothetical protein